MRILIHCSGGGGLGAGHVVRSAALADEAVASGHEVVVVGTVAGELLSRQVSGAGGTLVQLAVDQPLDVQLDRAIEEVSPEVVHLDSYEPSLDAVAGRWVDSGKMRLSNMSDGAFGRRAADLCIDPNYGAEESYGDLASCRVALLGSRFAPLRRAVQMRRGHWRMRAEVANVLVVMGGTDPFMLTPRALGLLAGVGQPLHVTAVVPPAHMTESTEAARRLQELDVDLVPPTDKLPALIVDHDLVLSAAGTTAWELCCIGVPMLLTCVADNQRAGYDRLLAAGAAAGVELDDTSRPAAVRIVAELISDPAIRQRLADTASAIVDGLGSWRIVRAWEQLVGRDLPEPDRRRPSPRVRRARMEDAPSLWRWRNDPVTRKFSRNSDFVAYEDHLVWLSRSLQMPDRLLMVAEDEVGEIGTVRWDEVRPRQWEVSITVAPERRGQSLAGAVLRAAESELAAQCGEAVFALATVHLANDTSIGLFESAGYVRDLPADRDGQLTFVKVIGPGRHPPSD